ncbi:MAG: hypothetical protein AAF512_18185, partial [Pseudomonadota bacterium]
MRNRPYNDDNKPTLFDDLERLKTVCTAIFIFALFGVVVWATWQQQEQANSVPYWIHDNLGDTWYGLYLQGQKTGYVQANWSHLQRESVFRYQQQMHLRRPSYGEGATSYQTIVWKFADKPPYRLQGYNEQRHFGDNQSSLILKNDKPSAAVTRQQAGVKQ